MPLPYLNFENVSFSYESSAQVIFTDLSVQFLPGWCGVIGVNGCGKTTLLRLACGELEPTSGKVTITESVVHCPQGTDVPPQMFEAFLTSQDPGAFRLRGKLQISLSWISRWPTLSHGERKRAQIATALWQEPRVLAIDEPTNHIDAFARELLIGAMRPYRGVGLLISHDRELLDELCERTLFVQPPKATLHSGGYSKAIGLANAEQERLVDQRRIARQELHRIRAESAARQNEARQADRKRSLKGVSKRDSDARARMSLVRVSGKDGKAGRLAAQYDQRVEQAEERLNKIQPVKEYRLGIELTGEPSNRNWLLYWPSAILPLGGDRILQLENLVLRPEDRVAIVGPNGAGKSTLATHIVANVNLPRERVLYMPQEIDRTHANRILDDVRRLPSKQLGDVMTIISCLGSRPERLLKSAEPSPGELRKLQLALGMSRLPNLIVLDEPTNHLDLPSIECLEKALSQVRCAVVLVSHDYRFLEQVSQTTWKLVVSNHRTVCEVSG